MEAQDIIREICVNIPLVCQICRTPFRYDRIDITGGTEKIWRVQGLCSTCNQSYPLNVNFEHPDVRRAREAICGNRSIAEEVQLRSSGEIPPGYERQLPDLLGSLWEAGPKDEPKSPFAVS
ncbi:MAG: hypothetical protein A3A57_01220 [Candidatus Woykebacteria bacterium RIFCSPLOWO2_01_FULL_41_12]|uniref:Uncharacterized protein n=1 Tax=Candidatus Woykebacteria bacterium RIFCSPLOWO2_01_FULL_41_12 TaxID=1802604 RepID=A0A1G1WXW2_9BACT|nr:MAG: hypothetical protein A3A57_01220 [Candidatus Woykebacteria bacterium RIFCSPLOWO2_01_FULL_41_12]